MTVALLFGTMFLLMFIGVPIALSLGIASLVTMAFATNSSLSVIIQKAFTSLDGYSLFYISWSIDGIWWYIQKIVEFGNRFNWIYYWWFGNGNSISEHVFCSYFRFWASYRCCYRIFYDPIDERSSIQARICCSD